MATQSHRSKGPLGPTTAELPDDGRTARCRGSSRREPTFPESTQRSAPRPIRIPMAVGATVSCCSPPVLGSPRSKGQRSSQCLPCRKISLAGPPHCGAENRRDRYSAHAMPRYAAASMISAQQRERSLQNSFVAWLSDNSRVTTWFAINNFCSSCMIGIRPGEPRQRLRHY
jgi:hypothetical protein